MTKATHRRRRHRRAEHSTTFHHNRVFNGSFLLLLLAICFGLLVPFIHPVHSFSFYTPKNGESTCRIHPPVLSQARIQTSSEGGRQNLLRATAKDDGYDGLGEYDPSEGITPQREVVVGDPQIRVKERERSVTSILKELAAIQQQGPQKYCILGTRHCSYLHQQIIELLYDIFVVYANLRCLFPFVDIIERMFSGICPHFVFARSHSSCVGVNTSPPPPYTELMPWYSVEIMFTHPVPAGHTPPPFGVPFEPNETTC